MGQGRRIYENRTQPLPEETIETDSASTLFQKFELLTTSLDAETFSGRSDWIEQIEDDALAGRLKQLSPADLELLTLQLTMQKLDSEIKELESKQEPEIQIEDYAEN